MRFLRHIETCNRCEPDRFRPLLLDGIRLGSIRADRAPALAELDGLFRVTDRAVILAEDGPRGGRLTERLLEVTDLLVARGLVPQRRGERFAIMEYWGGPTLFELDRGAIAFFGTRSYGVHVNGLVGSSIWVATRSHTKKVAPGKLDNLVAGGIAAGYGARATLIKEAAEEAGIAAELAQRARPVGAASYRMEVPEGLRDDVLFMFDLDLPEGFAPVPVDGECESFRQMPLDEVLRVVAETDDFKFNVNLVLIDLALRRGLVGPDEPGYLALVDGLHARRAARASGD